MERHERQEDDADDQNAEEDRSPHFFGGLKNHLRRALPRRALVLRQMPIDVFHHDQRSVRDLTDGDSQPSERHQVGREP